jgi:hypothetical protein
MIRQSYIFQHHNLPMGSEMLYTQGAWENHLALKIRPKSSSFHSPDGRDAEARLRINCWAIKTDRLIKLALPKNPEVLKGRAVLDFDVRDRLLGLCLRDAIFADVQIHDEREGARISFLHFVADGLFSSASGMDSARLIQFSTGSYCIRPTNRYSAPKWRPGKRALVTSIFCSPDSIRAKPSGHDVVASFDTLSDAISAIQNRTVRDLRLDRRYVVRYGGRIIWPKP